MELSEIAKIEAAREMLGALKDRYGHWTAPADKVVKQLALWLDGEEIEYVEFGWDDRDQIPFLEDATGLWCFVLTPRFAALATAEKSANSINMGRWVLRVAPRNRLTGLEAEYVATGSREAYLTMTLGFRGFDRDIKLPGYEQFSTPTKDERMQLFRELREDLFAQE